MKKTIKRIFAITSIVLLAVIAYFCYNAWVSPTRIGFINYPDYLFARFDDANSNSFIKVERIIWKREKDKVDLSKFDAVYIFGMGLRLPAKRMEALQ